MVAPLGITASAPDTRTSPGAIFGYVFTGVVLVYLGFYLYQLEKRHRLLSSGGKSSSSSSISSSSGSFPFQPEAGGNAAPAAAGGGGLGPALEKTRGPIWNRVRAMSSQEDLEGRVVEC